jgi:predicted component of type VI protein secretion system
MTRRLNFIFAMLLLMLTGCQSAPHLAPGMSGLRISVIAEPKAGVKDPAAAVKVYDTPTARQEGAFERVDYSALHQIVVWAEPAFPTQHKVILTPVTVNVSARTSVDHLATAASVGQQLIVHNNGSTPGSFYSVSDGNAFDLGKIGPGGHGEYTIKSSGLIEILSTAVPDPVASVYAAPSGWRAMTHSGATVDFTNLPPGDYHIYSWHPRLPGTEETVSLSPGQIAKVTIKVGVNALPKVGPR